VLDISYHTLQAYLRYKPRLRTVQRALPPAAEDSLDAAVEPAPRSSTPSERKSDGGTALPIIEATLAPD